MPKRAQKGKGILDFFKKAHNFVKSNRLVSTVAGLIPDARAQKVATIASTLGYGKKRRRTRRVGAGQGGGFLPIAPLLGIATKLLGGRKRRARGKVLA